MSDAGRKKPAVGPQGEAVEVLTICGLLCGDARHEEVALAALRALLGPIELLGQAVPFDSTRYYEPEMGPGLIRRYVGFERLGRADELSLLKHRLWALERELGGPEGRSVNLDPGYVDLGKVVLASFKSGAQKVYLGQQVWADLVLHYSKGAFRPLPWTFPDLKGSEHEPFFKLARSRYKTLLKAQKAGVGP